MPYRIRYVAPALCPDGYGEFSRSVIWALHRAGHQVSVTTFLHNAQEPAERFGEKGILAASLVDRALTGPPDINIVNATPGSFSQYRINSVFNVGFTMFEAERLSEPAVRACNEMDAIFVPSRLDKRVFLEHGVTPPIFLVQPPIGERSPLPPRAPVISDGSEKEPWTFYSVFEWTTPHKDPMALLTAYYQEFSPEEPVCLRVKTFERRIEGSIEREIRSLKARLGIQRGPKVELVMGSLSSAEMWEAYSRVDCYVSSHHGEGWGLPIWEAMAAGLPTIATGYGANMEFMDANNSYPVEFGFNEQKRWADVNVPMLRNRMRYVYANREEAANTGAQARVDIFSRFSEARTVSMVEQALQERAA